MNFLVPAFLAGLAALAVPVLLHLRHRDKETPQRFPSLMFLDRLPIRTSQQRRITDWPLLLLRALALVLLVLAFARPFMRERQVAGGAQAARTVIVLLDRSSSMSHRAVWPAALDSARRVINALGPGDRVAIVLFDDEAEIVQPLTADRAVALGTLAKARPGAAGTRYAAGLRAARQLVADEGADRVEVVVVSDLQRSGISGVAGLELPASFAVRAAPVGAAGRANARVGAVDARRAERAGRQQVAIRTSIESRGGAASRRVSAMLRLNGRPSGTIMVDVPATGDAAVVFESVPLPSGLVRGEITIDPDDLAADDTAWFTLAADDALRVLLVARDDVTADETAYFERALAVSGSPSVRIERIRGNGLSSRTLDGAALVLLWDTPVPSGGAGTALTEWVQRGGGLLVAAGGRLGVRASSTSLIPASVSGRAERDGDQGASLGDVRVDHPLLAPFREARSALYAPRFLRYSRLEPAERADVVARFDDGTAALVERREGAGRVVMVGVPLDARAGDFPLQPAFLPFVRRLVLHTSSRDATVLARATGESWLLPGALREPVVSTPAGSIVRPERDPRGATIALREAGIYSLYDGSVRGAPMRVLAANAPAAESDLTALAPAELLVGTTQASAAAGAAVPVQPPDVAERRQGFWRLLLGALALLLVGEMIFANRGWRGSASHLALAPSERRGP
jgi:hypothetical protein